MSPDRGDGSWTAFRLAYDGRGYHGFQRQPDVPTIEGALLTAFHDLEITPDPTAVPPGYAAASRTDAGVSAAAQTIAFRAPEWLTPAALNGRLPDRIRVWDPQPVEATFDPRRDAIRRRYSYLIDPSGMDIDRARVVCRAVEGVHDFYNLTSDTEHTIREIYRVTLDECNEFLRLTVTADGFLRQQVRRLATLVETVGRDRRPLTDVDRVLAEKPLPGRTGIAPADPTGLLLDHVEYEDVTFDPPADDVVAPFRAEAKQLRKVGAIMDDIATARESYLESGSD